MTEQQSRVEGYGVVIPEYDAPYLKGAGFDPNVAYAFAGDPEKQEELQKELAKAGPTDDFHVSPQVEQKDPTYPQAVPADLLPPKAIIVGEHDKVVVVNRDAKDNDEVIGETVNEDDFDKEEFEKENKGGLRRLDDPTPDGPGRNAQFTDRGLAEHGLENEDDDRKEEDKFHSDSNPDEVKSEHVPEFSRQSELKTPEQIQAETGPFTDEQPEDEANSDDEANLDEQPKSDPGVKSDDETGPDGEARYKKGTVTTLSGKEEKGTPIDLGENAPADKESDSKDFIVSDSNPDEGKTGITGPASNS